MKYGSSWLINHNCCSWLVWKRDIWFVIQMKVLSIFRDSYERLFGENHMYGSWLPWKRCTGFVTHVKVINMQFVTPESLVCRSWLIWTSFRYFEKTRTVYIWRHEVVYAVRDTGKVMHFFHDSPERACITRMYVHFYALILFEIYVYTYARVHKHTHTHTYTHAHTHAHTHTHTITHTHTLFLSLSLSLFTLFLSLSLSLFTLTSTEGEKEKKTASKGGGWGLSFGGGKRRFSTIYMTFIWVTKYTYEAGKRGKRVLCIFRDSWGHIYSSWLIWQRLAFSHHEKHMKRKAEAGECAQEWGESHVYVRWHKYTYICIYKYTHIHIRIHDFELWYTWLSSHSLFRLTATLLSSHTTFISLLRDDFHLSSWAHRLATARYTWEFVTESLVSRTLIYYTTWLNKNKIGWNWSFLSRTFSWLFHLTPVGVRYQSCICGRWNSFRLGFLSRTFSWLYRAVARRSAHELRIKFFTLCFMSRTLSWLYREQ